MVGKSRRAPSGTSRDPRQGTLYLGPRVPTCHLVLGLGEALSEVGFKERIIENLLVSDKIESKKLVTQRGSNPLLLAYEAWALPLGYHL